MCESGRELGDGMVWTPLLLLVQKGENRRCRSRTVTVLNPLLPLPFRTFTLIRRTGNLICSPFVRQAGVYGNMPGQETKRRPPEASVSRDGDEIALRCNAPRCAISRPPKTTTTS